MVHRQTAMHQHPRPPPSTASPANSDQTNPTRTNNPRDRDVRVLRTNSTQGSGSSEDFASGRQDTTSDNNPAAQMQRLNQVIQNFHTKATLIVLHSRVDLPEAYSAKNNEKRVNRWFNIELDETDEYNDDIRRWRKCDLKADRPPPLVIEIYLTTDSLAQGQRLVILDEEEKRWDVSNALASIKNANGRRRTPETSQVLLERWTIELGEPTSSLPSDLTSILPLVYKKSIVLFRSLYTYCNFLPTWKLSRKVGKNRHNMAMKIGYRIVDGSRMQDLSRQDNLDTALCDTTTDVATTYTFGVTESPAGPFSVKVKYRENCDFRIDDTEELLSSRFLGVDDELFRPSIPQEDQSMHDRESTKVGSLPSDSRRNLRERPELGHAYGSLSTFHQAGFSPGTSPLSALRSARELGEASPSPESTRPLPQARESGQGRSSLRAAAAGRRSSISLQPFKTPTLSASPIGASPIGGSPRTSMGKVPTLGSLTEEGGLPLPNAQAVAARRTGAQTSEQLPSTSTSSSPKPAPVRYSSSFSHRKSRPSIDRITSKNDDDQSSGKGSATSSNAPPGSGLITEPQTGANSSGSMQEDDENISDFLKMLDTKKDRSILADTKSSEAAARRTTNALNRYHRMRDTNAALSDSMSSSLMMQRSSQSSSRQLSSVPPMVGPASASTASSPGKPISPHTPHTPFAPSRLSAAYSHEDAEAQQHLNVEEDGSPGDTSRSSGTAQAESSANVPAIDIPNSPRPFLPNYHRSSSAQRGPPLSEDEIAYQDNIRSASMGAQDRKPPRPAGPGRIPGESGVYKEVQRPHTTEQSSTQKSQGTRPTTSDGAVSDSGSNRSSANNAYRLRLSRGSMLRGNASVTPPQTSTSSFGGTGGSLEREGDSAGSGSGSWGRGGHRFRPSTRTERPVLVDDDEFLPFAIDKSDFQTTMGRGNSIGEGN